MKTFKLELPKFEFADPPLKDGSLGTHPHFYLGGNSVFLKNEFIQKYCPEILLQYAFRGRFGVKIYNVRPGANIKELPELLEQTKIQNIFAFYGLAPQVYDLVNINDGYFPAQIVEEIYEPICREKVNLQQTNRIIELVGKHFGIEPFFDNYLSNIRGKRLVDFDNFVFSKTEDYKNHVIAQLKRNAFSGYSGSSYQQFPELGITSGRTVDERLAKLGLANLDLTGKTVLEFGCSGGAIANALAKNNPYRYIGIDLPYAAEVARETANYLGNFNLEFYGYDLTEENFGEWIRELTGIDKFDIILIFSMNHHIGFRQYMHDLAGGEVYVECNAARSMAEELVMYPEEFAKLGFDKNKIIPDGWINEAGQRALLKIKK